MENNPFEVDSNKRQDPFSTKKGSQFPKMILILIGIIVVVALYKGPISSKIADIRFEKMLEEEISYFQGDLELLGQGTVTSLTSDEGLSDQYTRFIDEGYVYYYDDVDPGVYTIELISDDKLVFSRDALSPVGYLFGPEAHDDVIKELDNVTIRDEDVLFVESVVDFELKLTPQDQYIEFDPNNIQSGVYTAGINIEPGTYSFSSTGEDDVNIVLNNFSMNSIVSTDEIDSFTLEEGDYIIIDNVDLSIELQ